MARSIVRNGTNTNVAGINTCILRLFWHWMDADVDGTGSKVFFHFSVFSFSRVSLIMSSRCWYRNIAISFWVCFLLVLKNQVRIYVRIDVRMIVRIIMEERLITRRRSEGGSCNTGRPILSLWASRNGAVGRGTPSLLQRMVRKWHE